MVLSQRPVFSFGAVLVSLACGCTSFVGANDASASESITDSSDGSTAGTDTPDPTVASASGSAGSTSTTAGPSSVTTDDSASTPTTLDETTSGAGTTTSSEESMSEAESNTDDSTSTSEGASSSSSSTGDPMDPIGMACAVDTECAQDQGQVCCTANECLNTCMVPCNDVKECPEGDMACGHGYCLFPCEVDADCDPWQEDYFCDNHGGGTFCEM